MKFNWGHGIALFLIVFVVTTVGVVIKISTDDTYSHELVSENYYEDELKYQEEIDYVKNASELSSPVRYRATSDGLLISFPKDFSLSEYKGTVKMQRPSNKILDLEIPIVLDENHQMLISRDKALEGKWNLRIEWEASEKKYLYKAKIRL
ncbi:MAG: FixH family protein [Bacteroidota bacterium]